jgi:uncharacterized repeat protein (TIGR01451 family)
MGEIASNGNNLSDDDSCSAFFTANGDQDNITSARDSIGDLADNGGPTQTHALLEGSTAVDGAGDCDLTADQRGEPRPSGDACDIGAFEVQEVAEADLAITKTVDRDTAGAGVDLTYTITVANNGPDDAVDVSMNELPPEDLTFQSLTAPPGWTCGTPPVGGTGASSCTIASLSAGAQAQFTFVMRISGSVDEGDALVNMVILGTGTIDPDESDNEATATTTIGEASRPFIIVSKSASPFAAVQGGSVFYYVSVYKLSFGTVTLLALEDSAFGDLNGKGSCVTGVEIGPLGYHCAFAETIDFAGASVHTNTVTATAANTVGQLHTATDNAVVLRSRITETTCRFLPWFCR